jgi:hypothetical protein
MKNPQVAIRNAGAMVQRISSHIYPAAQAVAAKILDKAFDRIVELQGQGMKMKRSKNQPLRTAKQDQYLSVRDIVKRTAPEPEVLRVIGEESQRNGTSRLTTGEIDQIIKATRAQKKKR